MSRRICCVTTKERNCILYKFMVTVFCHITADTCLNRLTCGGVEWTEKSSVFRKSPAAVKEIRKLCRAALDAAIRFLFFSADKILHQQLTRTPIQYNTLQCELQGTLPSLTVTPTSLANQQKQHEEEI